MILFKSICLPLKNIYPKYATNVNIFADKYLYFIETHLFYVILNRK